MYTVYGIPNCDTVKKTLDWLTANKIKFQFHNYKVDSISANKLNNWCKQKGWEMLLNKKSATWRGLEASTQAKIINQKAAVTLMSKATSIIKRPVVENEKGEVIAIGFDATLYKQLLT
jgi:Spx/MgsR family transcriptional regulator